MCGIAGYFGHRKLSDKIISNTFDLMHSRGPDSKNFYKLRIKDKSLYLLHTRLKIIDLSAYFRLDHESVYNHNYNQKHTCPELLNEFVYGLFD